MSQSAATQHWIMSRSAVTLLSTVLILWCTYKLSDAISCESCGRECQSSCGTRNFRACCFNYLKKRSNPTSGVRLELMMVVPELEQYYPSLKNSLMSMSDSEGGLKIPDEIPDMEAIKEKEPK